MLKTLEEHNAGVEAKRARYDEMMLQGRRNGIACPECGEELLDAIALPYYKLDGNQFSTIDKQLKTECSSCEYKGWRAAL